MYAWHKLNPDPEITDRFAGFQESTEKQLLDPKNPAFNDAEVLATLNEHVTKANGQRDGKWLQSTVTYLDQVRRGLDTWISVRAGLGAMIRNLPKMQDQNAARDLVKGLTHSILDFQKNSSNTSGSDKDDLFYSFISDIEKSKSSGNENNVRLLQKAFFDEFPLDALGVVPPLSTRDLSKNIVSIGKKTLERPSILTPDEDASFSKEQEDTSRIEQKIGYAEKVYAAAYAQRSQESKIEDGSADIVGDAWFQKIKEIIQAPRTNDLNAVLEGGGEEHSPTPVTATSSSAAAANANIVEENSNTPPHISLGATKPVEIRAAERPGAGPPASVSPPPPVGEGPMEASSSPQEDAQESPLPQNTTNFEECLRHTDTAITANHASDAAAAWAQRLVDIANETAQASEELAHPSLPGAYPDEPAQSNEDLAYRRFEAYMRQAKLRGPERTDQQGKPQEGLPPARAVAAARMLPELAGLSAHNRTVYEQRQFEGNHQAARTLSEVDPRAASRCFREAERFARTDEQRDAVKEFRASHPSLPLRASAQTQGIFSWGR